MMEYSYKISNDLENFTKTIAKHPFQSGNFAKFYSEQHGCKPFMIHIKEDGLLVAQLFYFLKGKGSETFSGFLGGKWVNAVSQYVFPELVWYAGPTFFGRVNKEEVTSYIIHVLGKEHGAKRITADLPFVYGKNKWGTIRINLRQSIDDLWNRIDKSARKNISKTEVLVDVSVVNDVESVKKYLDLLRDSRKHLGFVYLPPVHVNDLLVNIFRRNAMIVLVTEKKTGKAIAGMGLLLGSQSCVEVGSAISTYCRDNKLYCGDLIKWEIIKYAKMQGLEFYDLGGCSPSPSNLKEVQIRKFKEKFGGDYVEYRVLR